MRIEIQLFATARVFPVELQIILLYRYRIITNANSAHIAAYWRQYLSTQRLETQQ